MKISNFKFQISNSSIWLLALIFLIIPTFWTLLRPGYFPMQDDLQAFRVFEMDKCFQDFQLPCRWVPDMGYGYGYPQFNFYSPGVFYLGELFHLIGLQFIDVVKLLFILGFVLSALTMFLFLRSFFGNLGALAGALLYTYVPFKAVEVYVRGSLSEFWALVIFPLLFYSSYQLITIGKKKYGFYFALSVGLMLVTHNLLSVIIFPVLAIWCLIILGTNHKWQLFWRLAGFGILGLGLASFFVLPALWEKQYVHTETLLSGYFDYRQHFVPWSKLFLSNDWGYGSSNLGQTERLNLSTGIIQWIVGLLGVILTLVFWKKEKREAQLNLVVGLLAALSLFMIHQKSAFIWDHLPFLNYLQFPWRFLALSIFFLSFLGAAAIYYLAKLRLNIIIITIIIIITVIAFNFSFFQPKDWFNISDQDKFSGLLWEKQLTVSIFDYLPNLAKLPPNKPAPATPEVLAGQAKFLNYQKGSNYQVGQVEVLSNASIRLPLFDFPGMKVFIQNQEVNHSNNDCRQQEYCLGLITFKLPPGSYNFKAQLSNTPVRWIGNLISLISLSLVISLLNPIKRRVK